MSNLCSNFLRFQVKNYCFYSRSINAYLFLLFVLSEDQFLKLTCIEKYLFKDQTSVSKSSWNQQLNKLRKRLFVSDCFFMKYNKKNHDIIEHSYCFSNTFFKCYKFLHDVYRHWHIQLDLERVTLSLVLWLLFYVSITLIRTVSSTLTQIIISCSDLLHLLLCIRFSNK